MNSKCPKCKINLIKKEENGSVSWLCPSCGYGYATTTIPSIYEDSTIYSIEILPTTTDSHVLKCISKINGKGFVECKSLLETGGIVFQGNAFDVSKVKNILDSNQISYRIIPEYKH